jgi:hypothetical protein
MYRSATLSVSPINIAAAAPDADRRGRGDDTRCGGSTDDGAAIAKLLPR